MTGPAPDPSGSLRIITLPNQWAHANCDYAMTTRLIPISPRLTRIDVCFLVREDAVEGVDYDPERDAAVWRATSEQDWELCELNQFVRWYLGRLSGADPAEHRSSTPECVLLGR